MRKYNERNDTVHKKPFLMALCVNYVMGKVRLNSDADTVKTIREGLAAKGGYCPCKVGKSEDIKCMCKEFREQIADPEFEGYCHCRLYYKEK